MNTRTSKKFREEFANLDVAPEAPFIGLRSYESEEKGLFFGRDSAAARLQDDILGSPITVLFAPSGTGKSSLVKAKVMVELEREFDAHVVLWDDWSVKRPLESIRKEVFHSLPDHIETQENDKLPELARAIHEQSGKGLVLILDQMEQFFILHPGKEHELGTMLDCLARFGPDAHTVLTLREEYLGHLDSLRAHLLTVNQSQFRLLELSEQEAREAIVKPLALFDGTIEPALVDRLLRDLSMTDLSDSAVAGVTATKSVSLPILQIVCRQLWNASNKQLTVALYEQLGGQRGIVASYVRDTMKSLSPTERWEMAQILDLLAPKAGVKMPYPVDILSSRAGVAEERVAALVNHLEIHRILRRREEGKIVELFHDAFSEVLRNFIDDEFLTREFEIKAEKKRRRQRYISIAVTVVLLMVGGTIWAVWHNHQSERQRRLTEQRDRLLGDLQAKDCTKKLSAIRVLREQSEGSSFGLQDGLQIPSDKTLQHIADALKKQNADSEQCPRLEKFASVNTGSTRLEIRYNPGDGQNLSSEAIQNIWQLLTQELWRTYGRRVPSQIEVYADKTEKPGIFVLKSDGEVKVQRAVQNLQNEIAVLTFKRPSDLEEELSKVSSVMQVREQPLFRFTDGQSTFATERSAFVGFSPRWSAPLWKNIDERVAHGSKESFQLKFLPAAELWIVLEAFRTISNHPAVYISEDLVKGLIEQRQRNAPCLVYAALDAFNTCSNEEGARSEKSQKQCHQTALKELVPLVRESIVKLSDGGYRPGTLTRLLDTIADVSESQRTPDRLVAWLQKDNGVALPPSNIQLRRRQQRHWACTPVDVLSSQGMNTDWDLVTDIEYDEKAPIRVRVSNAVTGEISRTAGTLVSDVKFELLDSRDRVFKRFGVIVPGISFTRQSGTSTRYRIDIHGKKQVVGRATSWHPITYQLKKISIEMPTAWVTTDGLDPFEFQRAERLYLYGWIESRFTKNDIKLLLRGVLGRGWTSSEAAKPEWRINDLIPWLLGSLPFWEQVCDTPTDGECFVKYLRETQRARLTKGGVASDEVAFVKNGIDALSAQKPEKAVAEFKKALQKDRDAAVKAFLGMYAQRGDERVQEYVNTNCEVPVPGGGRQWGEYYPKKRRYVEDALDSESDSERKASLRLCALMYDFDHKSKSEVQAKIEAFWEQYKSEQKYWSSSEKYWIGYNYLKSLENQLSLVPSNRSFVVSLVSSALREMKDAGEDDANGAADQAKALKQIHALCSVNDRVCHWILVDVVEQPNLNFDALPLYEFVVRTKQSAHSLTLQQIRRLQKLWETAKKNDEIQRPGASKNWTDTWKSLSRMDLEVAMHYYAPHDSPSELLSQLERIQTTIDSNRKLKKAFTNWVLYLKETLYEIHGDWEQLRKTIEQREKYMSPDDVAAMTFWRLLRKGDMQEAAKVAEEGYAASGWTDEHFLFRSALVALLHNDERSERLATRLFLSVKHMYRDYIRLMLWWRYTQRGDEEKAKQLLEERLLEIPANDGERAQKRRLEQGDLDPWREALVRYFLAPNEQNRTLIFDAIENKKAFDQGMWGDAGQSYSYFRCEGYFYTALRESVTAEPSDAIQRCRTHLKTVIDEKCYNTFEYVMADWLLKTDGCKAPSKKQ